MAKYKLNKPENLENAITNIFLDNFNNEDIIELDIYYYDRKYVLSIIPRDHNLKGIEIDHYDLNTNENIFPKDTFSSIIYQVNIDKDFNEIVFYVSGYPNESIKLTKINN